MNDDLSTDVLVIGAGTAGFGAAVAAARKGLSVHLIEASGNIGGVMAFCPGMPWGAAYPVDRSVGGLMGELANRLFQMDPPAAEKRNCALANFGPEILYDHKLATLTMYEMLEEAGVTLHLNTFAKAPVMDENRIASVRVSGPQGQRSISAGLVIDCSGDGDISVKAGVPHSIGDDSGRVMGVSLTFLMIGADWSRGFADDDPYFQRFAAKGIAEGRLHKDLAQLYMMKGFRPDTVFCNSVVIRDVDGTDPAAVARATQEGQRRCLQLARFLVSDVPGFERAQVSDLGTSVGVRETRRLEGCYKITGQDLMNATKFADGIVACDNPVDDVMRGGKMTHDAIVQQGAYYTIPFRALMPRKIENLMFAGRLVSADPVAFASTRGMPQCMAMGQACGVAAAAAVRNDLAVQQVDQMALVRDLQDQGVRGLGGQPL